MTSIIGNIVGCIERIVKGKMTKAEVDIALSDLATHKTEPLQWRTSVVDLLKLLDLDSSIQSRETLAGELGFPGHFGGSASDNTTLHRMIMEHIASRDTRIPKA